MEIKILKFFICLAFISTFKVNSQNAPPRGALISTDFQGIVGYSLEDLPAYALDDSINFIKNRVFDNDWRTRANMQLLHTIYRQIFRVYYFGPLLQLTLPPQNLWEFTFTSNPYEISFQGHPHIVRNYTFHSVLIGTASGINASEPSLDQIGGQFTDDFMVPVDPEHVFQRSGYACADESSFSLDTVNSENFLTYFDQECGVEPYKPIANRTYEDNKNCHWTSFPNVTCIESLEKDLGYINLTVTWTRLPWNDTIANKYRYGNLTSDTADIEGVKSKLEDEINVGYKFFEEDSCALQEGGSLASKGCVGGPGWRQLLRFTSSSINVGKTVLHLGEVRTELLINGVYEWDPCHLHYHFQHYENYLFGDVKGRKTGFCIQTTWRYFNNEYTPFNTPYSFCDYQGISVGWGDDYYAGLDCQWFDVTGLRPGIYDLKVIANPDQFICEGVIDLTTNGSYKWIPTNFTSNNRTVNRQACNFTDKYDANNEESLMYNLVGDNSLVTLPCKRRATLSPLKDCGFDVQHDMLECKPNEDVSIYVENQDKTNGVIRVCESSKQLGHSTHCEYVLSLANVAIEASSRQTLRFKCPGARSSAEPGGLYSILVSSLNPTDPMPKVTIRPTPLLGIIQMLRDFIVSILMTIRRLFGF